ncbi:MAG: flagellar hook protein [Bdellovibrionales bacterium CG12_big_fil_rev_8_21_14_0_65_38_15]|nr:MAG: flagellar hook protein [Bdellovibrionales bacterium CG22_combo_CG10-13_8_21_14_all_38_13]PIQ53598.1 MAG: flagellar hook protein [Bdellovibrionales bacterium CG12_big_fil_rev_8_21_14_0_65_38_15]PIR28398.1 MAG: flagellar hook protein [Bdellovibrionales bacterium CG11_big_fil_rev_8_21_14_0_20_38_13]
MGILRSFNIGISGLNAAGQGMGVIGDNIANAGTTGFKSSRAEFQDVLAKSLKGIDGGDQFGAGVHLAHIKPMMNQGDVTRTDSITDLAISGDGFFKVEAPFGSGYTRDGSMHFNKEGELVNSDGYKVTGFIADESGKITNKQEPIKLGSTTIPAQGTKEVKVNMNIDSRADILEFNLEKPEKTANFTHTMTVYDNIGTARLVTLAYNKVGNNQWKYRALVDGKDAEGGVEGKMYEQASGTLNFNDKGVLQEEISDNNAFNFNKGAAQGQVIAFDFGKALSEGGTGLDASTQYGSDSNINRHTQDGHSAGTLASLSFNDDGVLSAVYDNGVSRDISQMAIAKFENNEGLFKVGKNLYKESKNSGQAAIGKPGESGRGDVLAKSLELSNVDIANEFVGLMTSQRNFQANSRTLTTADQMLQEVLNIKR